MNCSSVKHLLSQTLKPPVDKVFDKLNFKIACYQNKLLKTIFLVPRSFILKYSYSSLKMFQNKVVNKGKIELIDATHDLYTLLIAIFQENDSVAGRPFLNQEKI